MENLEIQYCYLNSSTSNKLFKNFVSKKTDHSDQIDFIIEKQIGEKDSEKVCELQTKLNTKSDDRVIESKQEQRGEGTDIFQCE